VTGRKLSSAALLGADTARDALAALSDAGWVCVPRESTREMITHAWADALAEDAGGV
jgi:hypothetical protein